MHYFIYIFIALTGGVGPRAGYPTVTEELRYEARKDSTQIVRYDETRVGLGEVVRQTIAPAAKPSFKYRRR